MFAFLFELVCFFAVIGLVTTLIGCTRDGFKALRIKFRNWLMKDSNQNQT